MSKNIPLPENFGEFKEPTEEEFHDIIVSMKLNVVEQIFRCIWNLAFCTLLLNIFLYFFKNTSILFNVIANAIVITVCLYVRLSYALADNKLVKSITNIPFKIKFVEIKELICNGPIYSSLPFVKVKNELNIVYDHFFSITKSEVNSFLKNLNEYRLVMLELDKDSNSYYVINLRKEVFIK